MRIEQIVAQRKRGIVGTIGLRDNTRPYKKLSKAKNATRSYFVRKYDVLEQNRHYFWNQHTKISDHGTVSLF